MNQDHEINDFLLAQKQKLKSYKNTLKLFSILESLPIGIGQCIYVHNYKTKEITYQKGVTDFLGYSKEEFNSELIHSYIHPDDENIVLKIIKAAVTYATEKNLHEAGHLLVAYRLRKKNGDYIKVLRQSNVFETDTKGRLISNLSLLTDISYLSTNDSVEWQFKAKDLDEKEFKQYIGHQYQNFFTARELEIISNLNQGLQSYEIALVLDISKHTVDTHRRKILQKASCKNTLQLITFCRQNGII